MLSCLTLSAKVSVVTGSARRPDDDARRLGVLGRLGTWCAGHSWWVIGVWLVLLLGVTVGHQQLGGSYSDDFTVATSSAAQGSALLAAHEPAAGGQGGQLVFSVPTGSVTSHATAGEAAAAAVRALPHVLAVSDPLAGATISADRRAAYATVHFDTSPVGLGHAYVATVNTATAGARTAGVAVDYGGLLGQAARPKGGDARSERIGIAVAVLVLLLAFGSVYAAALPILSAVIGVVTGLGVLGMLASAVNFASVSPTLAVMMGLGVGIDYGLFLTTRHRQQVLDGADPIVAAGRTTAASGRAVVIAAVTVVIALLGLYASGLSFTGRLGVAGGVTVAVSAAAALTLVPALLGRAGRRIDRVTVRRPVAETAGSPPAAGGPPPPAPATAGRATRGRSEPIRGGTCSPGWRCWPCSLSPCARCGSGTLTPAPTRAPTPTNAPTTRSPPTSGPVRTGPSPSSRHSPRPTAPTPPRPRSSPAPYARHSPRRPGSRRSFGYRDARSRARQAGSVTGRRTKRDAAGCGCPLVGQEVWLDESI